MHTEHVKHLLPDYVLNKMESDAREQVEKHVQHCPACSEHLADIRETLKAVSDQQQEPVPSAYFTSILPRVREKLDRSTSASWWNRPVFSKFAVPFATAALVIGLLVNIKIPGGERISDNALMPVVEGLSPEDVVDFVMEAAKPSPWMVRQTQEVAQTIVGEHLTKEHFLEHAMTLGFQPGFDEVSSQQLLRELDEDQVEQLLKKLEERTTL